MVFAQLLNTAGGYSKVAEYLDNNPEKFQEFLDSHSSDMKYELRDFANMHLTKFVSLYTKAIERFKFLASFKNEVYEEGTLKAVENSFLMKNPIITFGYHFYTPSTTMEDVRVGEEEHF